MIDRVDKGELFIDGINTKNLSSRECALKRNNDIGMIFQNYLLNDYMTLYENVVLPMLVNKNIVRKDRYDRVYELIKNVGLEDKINRFPSQLSGGEQQRIAIARALANNPNIILADEPTGNLDDENERCIFELLKKMSENGKCVIVVSHNNQIKEYADVILNVKKGEIYVNN